MMAMAYCTDEVISIYKDKKDAKSAAKYWESLKPNYLDDVSYSVQSVRLNEGWAMPGKPNTLPKDIRRN